MGESPAMRRIEDGARGGRPAIDLEDAGFEAARREHAVDEARHVGAERTHRDDGAFAFVGREILGVEDLGDEPERRERVPQVVDEHRDVIAPLTLERALQAMRLERAADAREELAALDGLGHVRVGAFAKPVLDRVGIAARGREHEDGGAAAATRAQAAEDLEAVHARHRHVEQHDLRLALFDRARARACRSRAVRTR